MEKEVWKPVEISNGVYEISSHGKLRRFYNGNNYAGTGDRYKFIKGCIHVKGYLKYGLGRMGSFYAHRLVGMCFLDIVEGKPHINHKDGNKLNNYYQNLEWVTATENNLHAANVLGLTVIKPVTIVDRVTRKIHIQYDSEKSAKDSMGSLRGYLVVPTSEYSEEYVNSILDKPRKIVTNKAYVASHRRGLTVNQVIEARELISSGMKDYPISQKIGCHSATIAGIRQNKLYADVVNWQELNKKL